MTVKKKTQFKKMKDDITKVDEVTYYVKGSQPEPYMVFFSINKNQWLCDCMDFVMGNANCKHISKIAAIKRIAAS